MMFKALGDMQMRPVLGSGGRLLVEKNGKKNGEPELVPVTFAMMHDCVKALQRIAERAADRKDIDQFLWMLFNGPEMMQDGKNEGGTGSSIRPVNFIYTDGPAAGEPPADGRNPHTGEP